MPKRYVRGDRAFGRLIKQLPDSVTKELRQQLNQTGRTVLALEQRRVPVKSGAVRDALTYKIPPVRLNLKVGLVGKAVNRRLFYGWIVEWGRKASTVTVTRAAGTRAYQLHVPAMAPRHFVFVPGVREQVYAPYKAIWGNALSKAAAGVSDD